MAGRERMRLTDRAVARLRPREREYTDWDNQVAGLGVLLVRQKARAPLAAMAPDAKAGVGALRPKAHGFRLPHDDGEHRHGPVGGDRGRAQRCEPVPDVSAVDVGDLPSLEAGQDLVLQVAPIDIERSRLPEPAVSFEYGLGDGLEEGLGGVAGRVLSTSDRGERPDGP